MVSARQRERARRQRKLWTARYRSAPTVRAQAYVAFDEARTLIRGLRDELNRSDTRAAAVVREQAWQGMLQALNELLVAAWNLADEPRGADAYWTGKEREGHGPAAKAAVVWNRLRAHVIRRIGEGNDGPAWQMICDRLDREITTLRDLSRESSRSRVADETADPEHRRRARRASRARVAQPNLHVNSRAVNITHSHGRPERRGIS